MPSSPGVPSRARRALSRPDCSGHDERTTKLNDLAQPGDRLGYTCFGDDWDHEILIEEATGAEAGVRCLRYVAGQAACPPEDTGGWPGYMRLVDVLADPEHEEHRDMLDWLGLDRFRQFDPARFDPDEANRRPTAVAHAGPVASRH